MNSDINIELGLDIDSVFVPPKITTGGNRGEAVNMIFEANENHFFAYLGLIKTDSGITTYEPKVIKGKYDSNHLNITGNKPIIKIGDDTEEDNLYIILLKELFLKELQE